jgi:sulfonate transport system ATP-binding protein
VAILLTDRVLVLSHGRVALDMPVAIPRARERTSQSFAVLRACLLSELGVGVH